LRRHLKHIGYPLIGDAKHGKGVHNRFFRAQYNCQRLLLACTAMAFAHPVSGQPLVLQAALDAPFQRVLRAFDWLDFPPTRLQAATIAQGWGD
jgi:tRNA pseudouridine65 synthase